MKSKIVRKRLFAVALAAAMMSSAVDYSCVMEVRAEESAEEQNLFYISLFFFLTGKSFDIRLFSFL